MKSMRKYGMYVAQQFRVPRWKQMVEQVILGFRYNIAPTSYYKLKMFRSYSREKAISFIQHHEIVVLLAYLNREFDCFDVRNKLQFWKNCRQYGLPTAPTIAILEGGSMSWIDKDRPNELPPGDLIVKPINQWGGEGIIRWRYNRDGETWFDRGRNLKQDDLIRWLLSIANDQQYLLQRAVYNHESMRALSAKGLATVRIVTLRTSGYFRPLLASLRMPCGELCVDNFGAGGLASPVDLNSGTVGLATKKDIRFGTFHCHPDTGLCIAGLRLPFWKETMDLCVRAHRCFSKYASIGWDVAITDEGALLIEANLTWCVDLMQMTHEFPLGETGFTEAFLREVEGLGVVKSKTAA
jgi:hypothetical protein